MRFSLCINPSLVPFHSTFCSPSRSKIRSHFPESLNQSKNLEEILRKWHSWLASSRTRSLLFPVLSTDLTEFPWLQLFILHQSEFNGIFCFFLMINGLMAMNIKAVFFFFFGNHWCHYFPFSPFFFVKIYVLLILKRNECVKIRFLLVIGLNLR